MMQAERVKAMDNAAAAASANPILPAAVRVGIAALVEEVRELRAELARADRRIAMMEQEIDA